ncbi:hypothetical protein PsorP6_013254 [Peronosclerospora sorghi]|uniref:Uncharacterized protein n=1 Tax=Peronosclerospora sorghi TaxID=230839 RepID=A0ACC0WGM5_9STRA|nr:hypothetical protein PsorP6_013254 [Peronosclerospora sorghi]
MTRPAPRRTQGHTTRNGVSKERDELRQSHLDNLFPNHDKTYRSETLLNGKEFTHEDHWHDSKTDLMPRIGEKNRGPAGITQERVRVTRSVRDRDE